MMSALDADSSTDDYCVSLWNAVVNYGLKCCC